VVLCLRSKDGRMDTVNSLFRQLGPHSSQGDYTTTGSLQKPLPSVPSNAHNLQIWTLRILALANALSYTTTRNPIEALETPMAAGIDPEMKQHQVQATMKLVCIIFSVQNTLLTLKQ
jgi:hypothetical protein